METSDLLRACFKRPHSAYTTVVSMVITLATGALRLRCGVVSVCIVWSS